VNKLLENVRDAVIDMRDDEIESLVLRCLDSGIPPMKIIEEGVSPGLDEVGRRFEEGEYFLAELIMAGEVVTMATALLKDKIPQEVSGRKGKVVLATVRGDVHDIGKRIVGMMLQASRPCLPWGSKSGQSFFCKHSQ